MPAMYDCKVQIVRHIRLLEGVFTLIVTATFVQYGMHCAAYLERKMNKQAEEKPKVKKAYREVRKLRLKRKIWMSLLDQSQQFMILVHSKSMSCASRFLLFQPFARRCTETKSSGRRRRRAKRRGI